MSLFNKFRKKTGLALSGGSILGAAHIGVLKVIEEKEISINHVSGTSVGSFVGALYAFGKSPKEIEDISMNLKWPDVSNISVSKYGLLNNEKLGELVVEYLGDVNIEDSKIPLSIIATDISKGEKVILRKGNLAQAVRASSCIPGIFAPVKINKTLLVDGGVFENLPISPLKDANLNNIIAVDLLSNKPEKAPKNILDVLLNTFHYMIISSSQIQEKDIDVIIKPDLSSFNRINTKQTKEIIQKGYDSGKQLLK